MVVFKIAFVWKIIISKANLCLLPEILTWKSILSSTASQVYFPESCGVGTWMVRRRMSPSSVMVTLLFSSISLPFSHHLTSALGRDTSISITIGLPAKLCSLSGVFLGRVSVTGGSEGKGALKSLKRVTNDRNAIKILYIHQDSYL